MTKPSRFLFALLFSLIALALSPPVFAQAMRSIAVQVTHVIPGGNGIIDNNDQYVRISIDGQQSGERDLTHCSEGTLNFEACQTFEQGGVAFEVVENEVREVRDVLACKKPVRVVIEQFERGNSITDPNDDHVLTAILDFDPDNPPSPGPPFLCIVGGGGGVCFNVTVNNPLGGPPDSDGDGLLDVWELQGFDVDCDGTMTRGVDVFLHEMGVSPNHKDLLLEMSWFDGDQPTSLDVEKVQRAFALAPIDAGGIPNPDGLPGINLIVDAGNTIDPVREDVIGTNLGINARGGNNLGNPAGAPGQMFAAPGSIEELLALVGTLQESPRKGLFRYMLFGPTWDAGVGGLTATGPGGQSDVIYLGLQNAAAIMHEFGHSLGLQHGGNEPNNCKPNHFSVMNYSYGTIDGIPWTDPVTSGGLTHFFVDFAPSLIPVEALSQNVRIPLVPEPPPSTTHLPALIEFNLDEEYDLLQTTQQLLPRHQIIFTDGTGSVTRAPVNDPVNWNGSKDPDPRFDDDGDPVNNLDLGVLDDVDLDIHPNIQSCADNNLGLTVLNPVDEWSIIQLQPATVTGGLLELTTVNTEPLPTPEEIEQNRALLERADLVLDVVAEPLPARVGSTLFVDALITNQGPNPAVLSELRVTVPAGVEVVGLSTDCFEVAPSLVECDLGTLLRGEPRAIEVELEIGPNQTGMRREILLQALHLAGADTAPENNTAVIPLHVVPGFASFEDPARPWVRSWTQPPEAFPPSSSASDGEASIAVSCGYSHVESPKFDTTEWEVTGDVLAVDVLVPAAQSNPSWVGDVSLAFDLPALNLHNVFIGQQGLSALPRGVYSRVAFSLPAFVVEALKGDYPDAKFRFGVNVASCLAPFLLDNLRFEGNVEPRTTFHDDPGGGGAVVSVGALTFDVFGDWSSNVTLATDPATKSQGTASLAFDAAPWVELQSRLLTAAELQAVSSSFSIDVRVPALPANPDWVGQLLVFADCPSAELYSQFAGQAPLYPSFDEEFDAVQMSLPPHIEAALASAPSDCTVRLGFALNEHLGVFRVDNAGFVTP
jgi:hypothetical protein